MKSTLLLTPITASASLLLSNQSSSSTNGRNISSSINIPHISASALLPTNRNSFNTSNSCARTSTDPLSFINCGIGQICDAYSHGSGPNGTPTFSQFWCEAYGLPFMNKWEPLFYGMNASVKSHCLSFEEADYSSYHATQTTGWWSAITSAPCCDQMCSLKVASAQVFYWPTPAPVPNVTSVVGPDGFTYLSPSVYVVYYSVSATADCSNIGNTYASVTISYEQNELRTRPATGGPIKAFNFADLYSNCTTQTQCFQSMAESEYNDCLTQSEQMQDHCYPSLEYPYKVRALNPQWANCESVSQDRDWAVFDPPRALVSANAMAPKPTRDPIISLSAAPASSVYPAWPSVTTSPGDASPPRPSDPVVADPSDPPPDQSNGKDTSPQDPSNHQGADSPVQGDPGSGSKGSIGEGGNNQGSNDLSSDPQPLADPSPLVDPGPTPTIKWAGSMIQPGESSQYTIPNIGVLVAGGPAVTTNGVEYSLAPSATAILSNGHKADLAPVAASQPAQAPILTFAGSTYTANQASEFVIAGQTLTPGHSISPSGTPISLSPDGTVAVIGSSSNKQTLVKPVPSFYTPQLTLTGSAYTADPFGNFLIAGKTLTPGGVITVFNTPISLAPGGTIAVIGSETQLLKPPVVTAAPILTFNQATFTADSGGNFIIAGQTLTPGGAITVSGTPISVVSGGSIAVVGLKSQLLIPGPAITQAPVLTFDNTIYTADASSEFTIEGQTLTRGGRITVNGATLLFDVGGAKVVVGTSTQVLGVATFTGAEASTITFGGQTYTEDSSQGFVIGGQTLEKGGVITVDGTPVSFAAGGTDVVLGSSSTEAVGLGGWIMSGFGNGASTPTSFVAFEGEGARWRPGIVIGIVGIAVAVGVWK